MKSIAKLLGMDQKGPSKGEKEMQAERYRQATRAEAEADQNAALATRASSLRQSLSYRDETRAKTLG